MFFEHPVCRMLRRAEAIVDRGRRQRTSCSARRMSQFTNVIRCTGHGEIRLSGTSPMTRDEPLSRRSISAQVLLVDLKSDCDSAIPLTAGRIVCT